MKLNRREFLRDGLAGLFTGLLAWLGAVKVEKPKEEEATKGAALPDCPLEIYVGPVHCQEEPEKPIKPEGGKTWFVHWTEGEDGPDRGLSPDKPLATEAYALAQCSAPQGDMIFVLPGDGFSDDLIASPGDGMMWQNPGERMSFSWHDPSPWHEEDDV